MKESLTSYTRLRKLIKEALSKQPKKGCSCNSCKCKEKTNNNK